MIVSLVRFLVVSLSFYISFFFPENNLPFLAFALTCSSPLRSVAAYIIKYNNHNEIDTNAICVEVEVLQYNVNLLIFKIKQ